ncbi:MAG: AtpZ/AtpI family protein [Bacteroidota bacterium]
MSKSQKNKESKDRGAVNYAKYSGLAVQMGIIVFIGAFIGSKLDDYFATARPYFTVLFALIGILAALYLTLKDLIRNK